MKRPVMAAVVVALAAVTLAVGAQQPAPKAPSSAAASAAASAPHPGASASASAPAPSSELPPGHPPTGEMPPGHPPTGEVPADHPQQAPKRIPDRVAPDEELAPGTIDVLILDGDDQPVPRVPITLGILFNSVSTGESRERRVVTTDDDGFYRFEGLKFGSGIAYRITTDNGPASFGSQPFGLTDQGGMKVILHRYDADTTLEESRILMEAIVVLDIKQDAIAINHLVRVMNFSNRAFVATDVRVPFPPDYQGFDKEETMNGAGIIERDGAMEFTGTFPPGQTETSFRYQVPLAFGSDQKLRLPLPPRVARSRVILKAGKGMGLAVAGFPAAEEGRLNDGSRMLFTTFAPQTEAEMMRLLESVSPITLDVSIQGLPTPGPKRIVAVLLAVLAIAGGAFYLHRRREAGDLAPDQREDLEHARDTLLGEIALLEKMHQRGEVGPRSYETLRNQLLEALARIIGQLELHARPGGDGDAPAPKRAKRAGAQAKART
jgi:hypothetical protein